MGGSASRAFAEWQRETTLPESGLYSMGWARVKVGLRVRACLEPVVEQQPCQLNISLEAYEDPDRPNPSFQ